MTTKALSALVLHKRASGDTSLRVTFFTRELGIIECLCKGVRKQNKQVLLQGFLPLCLIVDERRGWFYASRIENIKPGFSLEGRALFAGLYLNELLYYSLKPLDAQADLYDAYQQTLEILAGVSTNLELEAALRRFEWTLLKACGQASSFNEEAGTLKPIAAENFYQFEAGRGFYSSPEGISGEHLLALAEDKLESVEILKTAKYILRKAIDYLLGGREIKARSLFNSLKKVS